MSAVPPLPEEIYITFSGAIDAGGASRIMGGFDHAVSGGVKKVHFLIQSAGGYVGEGIALYNFLRSIPIELITYNAGEIASAAILPYLTGKQRCASKNAAFCIHFCSHQFTAAVRLERIRAQADRMALDDGRMREILSEHLQLSDDHWDLITNTDLLIGAAQALPLRLSHHIADFAPPAGAHVCGV